MNSKKSISASLLFFIFAGLGAQQKFTDKRDGNIYTTIRIGNVTWMSENLKFVSKTGAYYFDNDQDNLPAYGVLYEWKSALNACPQGWRLPSGSDFQNLMNHFDQDTAWAKISSDNASFGIQLGGMQDYEGTFSEMDESGYYWTSTEYDMLNAEYFSYLVINDQTIIDLSRKEDISDIHGSEKSNKYSVRCIQD